MTNKRTLFPKSPSTRFVVRNIAPNKKTVRVFNTPIRNRDTYDLLSVPDISEADIRHSLLKGELLIKFRCKELFVVDSDIDLLQFNDQHKAFLQSIGIKKGLEVEPTAVLNFAFKQGVPLVGAKDGINRIFTVTDLFLNGSLGDNEFRITIRHNGKGLVENTDYLVSESGGAGTGFDTITFISFIPVAESELIADYVVEI